MITETTIECPACDEPLVVSGFVVGGDSYTIGEYGPPGCVFTDAVEVEDVTPAQCPYCHGDLLRAATRSLIERAEAF
jgi:ssDNA-binding Zn-finger/Zn-ribbon topoisomerase 1